MFEKLEGTPELAGIVIKILDLPSMLREAMTKKEAKASVTIARMESAILHSSDVRTCFEKRKHTIEASLAQKIN